MTVRTAASVTKGDALPPRTLHIERATLVRYAGASLDFNPIHWDGDFAREVGLPDVIAHGMFTMGAAAAVATDWAGDAGRVVRYTTKFGGPVVVPTRSSAGTTCDTGWPPPRASRTASPARYGVAGTIGLGPTVLSLIHI